MGGSVKSLRVLQVAAVDVTVEKLLLPLIDELIANGFTVDIACADGEHARSLRMRGYKIHDIPFTRKAVSLSHLRALHVLYKIIKKEHYDVVHVHTVVGAFIGRLAAKMAGVPIIIYTAHGFYFHENMPSWQRYALVSLEKILCRLTTDWLFTQSEEDAIFASKNNFLQVARILWIGNGVDVNKFSPNDRLSNVRESFNIEKDDRVIGFIGRIVREKGIIDLIEAFDVVVSKFPRAKLLIVGGTLPSDRDSQAMEKVGTTIRSRGLQNAVIFTGFREDVPHLFSAMDVFVLPSYREGMPRTIIEAMASGKPVVASNIRGCREEVVDGETGFLVPVRNPARLAQAISLILADKGLAMKMGEVGRERALEFFDERRTIASQLDVYKNL